MVALHFRKRKDGATLYWDVGGYHGVLTGHCSIPKTWRRGSVECMDEATIKETLNYHIENGTYFGPDAVIVVPEAAVVDALAGKVIEDPQAEYPCMVVPLENPKRNVDTGYLHRGQADLQRLQERAKASA